MNLRPMGSSGLLGLEIALGTMIFGENTTRITDQKSAIDITQNLFDQRARTEEQVSENLTACVFDIPTPELAELSELSRPERGYPYRFIDVYGTR